MQSVLASKCVSCFPLCAIPLREFSTDACKWWTCMACVDYCHHWSWMGPSKIALCWHRLIFQYCCWATGMCASRECPWSQPLQGQMTSRSLCYRAEHGYCDSVEAAAAQPAEMSGGSLRAQHTLGSSHPRFCGVPALLLAQQLGAARSYATQAAAGWAQLQPLPWRLVSHLSWKCNFSAVRRSTRVLDPFPFSTCDEAQAKRLLSSQVMRVPHHFEALHARAETTSFARR